MTDPTRQAPPPAAAPANAPGGDFNVIPYLSKPFPQSAPPRLAALAAMFGLKAPAVSEARVLELGCASGGNLIPLALRFPGARFRGVDLTERHVRDAQARIEALDLNNIRIQQGDIAALNLKGERFDYIVCHGVYSWVPEPVRAAILRICGEHLADTGVAYVSYNVYPGWQMRGAIRDMMVYHAGPSGDAGGDAGSDPALRVAKARWVLENIAKSTRAGTPYGEMLRDEAKLIATLEDAYILAEFLEQENAPCYFHDFAAKAQAQGLSYLCEADIGHCIPEHIGPEVGKLIRSMSANQLIPLEQYMDFFKGRTFRQTLLVKTPQEEIKRKLTPECLRDLHVSARLTCTTKPDGSWAFSGPNRSTLNTSDAAMHRALQRLAEVYPATRTVPELAAEVRATDRAAAIQDAVFQTVLVGLAEVSSVPVRLEPAGSDKASNDKAKPKAARLARLDAGQRLPWTAGPAHDLVPLDPVAVIILPLLDGTHDHGALKAELLAAIEQDLIKLRNKAGQELKGEALDAAAAQHVTRAVERLGSAGLLV